MLFKSLNFKNSGILLLLILLGACASSGAPVENARSQEVSSDIQTRPFEQSPQINSEPLSADRSTPPVVGKLLRQSEQAAQQEDWTRAESYLQRALRISPKNALLWSRMAEAKLKQGKRNQAEQFALKSNAMSSDGYLQQKNAEIIASARQQ
jgi:predicted Zn-dependent protease